MPRADLILEPDELRDLRQLSASTEVAPRVAWRARLILSRAASESDRAAAAAIGTARATVALWRRRYQSEGIVGLQDRFRPGRPSALATGLENQAAKNGSGPASLTDITLERLLAAASQTISRRGFASTRVSDIADQAAVSSATLHYYFKTKRDILIRSLLWANERLVAQLAQATDPDDPPRVRLAKFIERTIPYPGTQRDEYLLEIDLWSQVRIHPELLSIWEGFAERWIGHLQQILADGVADGSFSPVASIEEIAERIVAMTDGLSAQAGIRASRMPSERARSLLLEFAAEQLGVPADELEQHAHVPGIASAVRATN